MIFLDFFEIFYIKIQQVMQHKLFLIFFLDATFSFFIIIQTLMQTPKFIFLYLSDTYNIINSLHCKSFYQANNIQTFFPI